MRQTERIKPNVAIPEADRQLDAELREALAKVVSVLRVGLQGTKPGCACTDEQLCAHHVAIYRHLEQARVSLHHAIDQIERQV